MKLWIAHWLRKLASRLDGMPYDTLLSKATSDAMKDHAQKCPAHAPKCDCALPGINVPFRSGATPKTHLEWCATVPKPVSLRPTPLPRPDMPDPGQR